MSEREKPNVGPHVGGKRLALTEASNATGTPIRMRAMKILIPIVMVASGILSLTPGFVPESPHDGIMNYFCR